MNERRDNQTDQALQDWAKNQAVGADNLASLQRRIIDRILIERLVSPAPGPESVRVDEKRRLLAPVAAIAAAILVAFFAGWYLRAHDSNDGLTHMVLAPADWAQLLSEYKNVFGPEFSWLVDQPMRSEIGLRSPGADASAMERDFVVVRLILVARSGNGEEWKELQSLDVVARREELVEVAAKSNRHTALTLWAYPLDDKMISIDLRYEPNEFVGQSDMPRDLAIESSSVQRLGEPARVMSFENDGVEYRLYQNAVLLPKNGVG